jgi:hypothetical protein
MRLAFAFFAAVAFVTASADAANGGGNLLGRLAKMFSTGTPESVEKVRLSWCASLLDSGGANQTIQSKRGLVI